MTAKRTHRTYGLDRVTFNRRAKELRADDNLSELKQLAVGQVFPMPGPTSPAAELWQVCAHAAIDAIDTWWKSGGKLPHDRVRKAIGNAAREYRGRGGNAADVTFRGPYNTNTRRYLSHPDQFTPAAAEALSNAMDGEQVSEAPPEERAEDLNALSKGTGADRALGEAISEARDATAGSAEYISHTANDDSDERLSPRDDGETAYGVEGATRGLHTGSVVPAPYWIAEQMAFAEESDTDQAYFAAVESIGFEAWVGKDGNRKRARKAHERRYMGIRYRVRDRAYTILKATGDLKLQAAWLAAVPAPVAKPTPPSGPGLEPVDGVLSAAWPKEERSKMRGRSWGPTTVWRDRWLLITVGGHAWGDMRRNVSAWRRWHPGSLLSLLDLAEGVFPGVKVKTLEQRPACGGPIVRIRAVSLLDV